MKAGAKKIAGIAIVAALLSIAAFFVADRLVSDGSGAYDRAAMFLRLKRDAVSVADQGVSDEIRVKMAALKSPGFVAIFDDEEGPGKFLGVSRLLPKGDSRDVAVPIGQAPVAGYYYAMLRHDDGDGRFDPEKDAPVRDARGVSVMTRFLVSPRE